MQRKANLLQFIVIKTQKIFQNPLLNLFQKSSDLEQDKFILFADCIPVKGFTRSVICDTKNNNYHIIPNGLYDILENYNGKTIKEVKKEYDNQYDEYFKFLLDYNFIFFNSNPQLFPKLSTVWRTPSTITNAIIDYDENIHNFNNLLPQFETLKCSYIQLRFYKKINLEYINSILKTIKKEKSRIVSIDFIVPFYENLDLEALNILLLENTRIHTIIIYNSPYDKINEPLNQNMGYLMMVQRKIISEKNCGIINDDYFSSNIKLFSESQEHNTCLNRKISIDKEGNIKNCPSMLQSFGNIKDTTLEEALHNPEFKKYWNITKDHINVCKDCEFRHICTDCRAYIDVPENQYSKPLKCGYNPYTNVWEEWSTNSLKQKAIKYYGMQDLVKNKNR